MYKKIVPVLISLSLTPHIIASAGPLEKYVVPPTQSQSKDSDSANIDKNVYKLFREKTQDYEPDKKERLIEKLLEKKNIAEAAENEKAIRHYATLIGILVSSSEEK